MGEGGLARVGGVAAGFGPEVADVVALGTVVLYGGIRAVAAVVKVEVLTHVIISMKSGWGDMPRMFCMRMGRLRSPAR